MSARPVPSCVTTTRNCVSEIRFVLTLAPAWPPQKLTCEVTLPAFFGRVNTYFARASPVEEPQRRTRSATRPGAAVHEPLSERELVWTPGRV